MQHKKQIALIAFIIVNFILSITVLCLYLVSINSGYSASDIYNQCLYNVIEVKAEADAVGESYGTGEIISSGGKIVTNAHIVTYTRLGVTKEFEKYSIRFSYEDEYREVTLEKYDIDLDLAVLSIKDLTNISFQPAKAGNSDAIKSGDKVYAVGNASNYGIGIFEGIISIPLVNIELGGLKRSVIQCDLTIAAGNSGGALINEKGELIGLTTFRTKDNSGNVIYGIVYCIPINTALEYENK